MPFTTDTKVKAGFLALTLVPVLLGIVIWNNTEQLSEATRELSAANELVRRLESFLSRLKDVEVAEREYVLTGDESYVQELEKARQDVTARLPKLSPQKSDKHWIELLESLVPQKFEEIQKAIELRRSGDVTGSQNTIVANRGDQPMDDIRRVVHTMIEEESRLVGDARKARDARLAWLGVLSAVILFLNAGLIWSLFLNVQREARAAARANEELEEAVEQRTLELRRSNEELQQFAYTASHDLKEPMRMISSYAALLERRYSGQLGADAQTWIGFIVDGVGRMNRLITDLLDYSRAGLIAEDQKQELDPTEVLSAVLVVLKASVEESGAKVTWDNGMPHVLFEPVRMQQLLQNLVSNALKYRGPSAPKVHVSAKARLREVEFSVRDNGIGIAPQYQQEIFGIFKRLHGKEIEGTGVGLATCKRIVEEHGGRIWVESVEGQGSTFRFTVPAVKPETARGQGA